MKSQHLHPASAQHPAVSTERKTEKKNFELCVFSWRSINSAIDFSFLVTQNVYVWFIRPMVSAVGMDLYNALNEL